MRCPDCGSSDLVVDEPDGDYYDCNECGTVCISFQDLITDED